MEGESQPRREWLFVIDYLRERGNSELFELLDEDVLGDGIFDDSEVLLPPRHAEKIPHVLVVDFEETKLDRGVLHVEVS